MLLKSHTWIDILGDFQINTLEHPAYEWDMDKNTFYDCFKAICDQLDGSTMSDYISFFYISSPLCPSSLRFRDEDARQDFLDWAIDENCLPPLGELQSSESTKSKDIRQQQEAIEKQKKLKASKNNDNLQINLKKIITQYNSLQKLVTKNSNKDKINRSELHLKNSINEFKSKYDDNLLELLNEQIQNINVKYFI